MLAWCAGVLVGVELLWLLVANTVLALHLIPRAIAAHSVNVALDYERAMSLFPGDLRVQGFWIRGRDRRHVEWQFTVERGTASVALLPLLLRRFHARSIQAQGVTARFRKLESPERLAQDRRLIALSPPIAGFGPIARAPYGPEDGRRHPAHKRWTVDLEDTTLESLTELWVGPFRFAGQGRVHGRFFVKPRQAIEFGPSNIALDSGRIDLGEEATLLRDVHLDLEATLARLRPGSVRGKELPRLISGSVRGTAQLEPLQALRLLAPALPVRGGAGAIALDLSVAEGLLRPGSRVDARLPALDVDAPALHIGGDGQLGLRVTGDAARLRLSLPHATLGFSALPGLRLSGGLLLASRSTRIDLVRPAASTAVIVRGEALACDDLRPLARRVKGLAVTSGQARLDGELELFTDARPGQGALHLVTGPVAMHLGSQPLTAGLRADLHLHHLTRAPLSADLSDSSLAVTEVELPGVPGAHGFWLTAKATQARGRLGRHRRGGLVLDAAARDGRPLLALLARTGKLPRVATRLFSLPHLTLHAEGALDDGDLTLSALRLAGGKSELLGALHKPPHLRAQGAFLLRAGPLELGLGVGEKLQLHPVHGDAWFAAQQQLLRSARRPRAPPR